MMIKYVYAFVYEYIEIGDIGKIFEWPSHVVANIRQNPIC